MALSVELLWRFAWLARRRVGNAAFVHSVVASRARGLRLKFTDLSVTHSFQRVQTLNNKGLDVQEEVVEHNHMGV